MSESLDGVNFSATRQKAGSVLNAAAFALAAFGGVKAPAWTSSADCTCPLVIFICARASHAIGAVVAEPDAPSVATPSSAIQAILMRGSVYCAVDRARARVRPVHA